MVLRTALWQSPLPGPRVPRRVPRQRGSLRPSPSRPRPSAAARAGPRSPRLKRRKRCGYPGRIDPSRARGKRPGERAGPPRGEPQSPRPPLHHEPGAVRRRHRGRGDDGPLDRGQGGPAGHPGAPQGALPGAARGLPGRARRRARAGRAAVRLDRGRDARDALAHPLGDGLRGRQRLRPGDRDGPGGRRPQARDPARARRRAARRSPAASSTRRPCRSPSWRPRARPPRAGGRHALPLPGHARRRWSRWCAAR